ncbi:WXG100 family type VII secretion target [Nocardia sp. 2]|uniref:WXG100 family type VII secretion target n=1 Tax=Nocardia acididurans TaxID=2802282 RepID=A0ABS1M5U7_9NOCA|nr:WXG100 family type VII secretion target [Nocardia acididurans]MBL1075174.1 WXG100 family type VII secretion target [Nocardia acididurans]
MTAAAQSGMAEAIDTVQVILSKITDAVETARKGFQGTAGDAFQGAATAWDGEALKLKNLLSEFEAQVGVGKTTFANMDQESGDGFMKLTNL